MTHISRWHLWYLVLLFLTGVNCRSRIDVHDNFEAPALSGIWSTETMVPQAFEIQSTIVRKGKSAARITLRSGDVAEPGTDKSQPTERDELLETNALLSFEGVKYEYQFSMFLPDSFPIVPTRLVIAQWKQKCPGGPCSDDSPVLAVRYVSGKLLVTLNTDSARSVLYRLDDEIRNRWLDFRFRVRFSRQSDGTIEAFLNEKGIIHYKGVTSYSEKRGYPPKDTYYFKMGLYRDRMPEPMSIYIDEYRKKELVE